MGHSTDAPTLNSTIVETHSKGSSDNVIHWLHGKRRPIATTPPADLAGSSHAQLQALLDHVRRAQRPSGPLEGDEKTRIAEARRRDKALLTDWARNAGVLIGQQPPGRLRWKSGDKPERAVVQANFDMAQL